MRMQHAQQELLVQAITALTEAQTQQAQAYQKQVEQIMNIWNQPPPPRDENILAPREQELLRDLKRAAEGGDPLAQDYLKPENKATLDEYLALFRDS